MRSWIVAVLSWLALAPCASAGVVLKESAAQPASSVQAHLESRGLKPGMVVLDRRGAKVGVILRIAQTRAGRPAVLVQDNGAQFTIRDADLRLSRRGDQAITRLSRSEIRTRAILNTY